MKLKIMSVSDTKPVKPIRMAVVSTEDQNELPHSVYRDRGIF